MANPYWENPKHKLRVGQRSKRHHKSIYLSGWLNRINRKWTESLPNMLFMWTMTHYAELERIGMDQRLVNQKKSEWNFGLSPCDAGFLHFTGATNFNSHYKTCGLVSSEISRDFYKSPRGSKPSIFFLCSFICPWSTCNNNTPLRWIYGSHGWKFHAGDVGSLLAPSPFPVVSPDF